MPRVKRGTSHVKKRRKILSQTKGFQWGRKSKVRLAKTAILKAGVYAFRDRRNKKRSFRNLWNLRINAAVRPEGLSYSRFIHSLKQNKVTLNRKVLAELAQKKPQILSQIIKQVTKQ